MANDAANSAPCAGLTRASMIHLHIAHTYGLRTLQLIMDAGSSPAMTA